MKTNKCKGKKRIGSSCFPPLYFGGCFDVIRTCFKANKTQYLIKREEVMGMKQRGRDNKMGKNI